MIPEEQARLADALVEEFDIHFDDAVERAGKIIEWLRLHDVEMRVTF